MSVENEESEASPAMFRLRFEYLGPDESIVRSEKVFTAHDLLAASKPDVDVGRAAVALHAKIINALREDGIIPPPSNVIKVDFTRGKRC
ncbi:hypothetical protein [Burkholderia anthina]|uniref:hypothetical protein n=1 Tax=Burkholderia anthina TaxID=179879 RepID=UPI00158B5CEE|nr:hypothetical protein [Burkholderia anthina]